MAADSDTNVRQRKPDKEADDVPSSQAQPAADAARKTKKRRAAGNNTESRWVDVARTLTLLIAISCGLSYLVSSGESFFWSMRVPPKYMRLEWWQSQLNGPKYLTPEQLRAYDGSDPDKPIYLAINHTIYDVSAGARLYGPGGGYSAFAGVDASRGYVTGCFKEDQTPDMRGVEDMYLPLDDPDVDKHWTKTELKLLKEQEKRQAEKKVYEGLRHWVDFFANSKKYGFVGYVKRPADWLQKEPKRELCEQAAKGRKPRVVPEDAR